MKNVLKALVCSFLLVLISNYSFSQSDKHQYDDILKNTLQRCLYPKTFKDTSGAIIFKISKVGGIIKVNPIFISDTNVEIKSLISVYNSVNSFDNSRFFVPPFELIVPVSFVFCGENHIVMLSKEVEEKMAKRLKDLKEEGITISNMPVTIIQYAYIKHTDWIIDSTQIDK